MKFRYIGQESEADAFGLTFRPGEAVEVHDAHAIKKLSNHPLFEADDGEAAVVIEQPKRRGRPPKVTHGEQNGS